MYTQYALRMHVRTRAKENDRGAHTQIIRQNNTNNKNNEENVRGTEISDTELI